MKEEVKNKAHVKITYDVYKKIKKVFPKTFLKMFLIPTIIWLLLSLLTLIPDENETDPVTLGELIVGDIIFVLIIFGVVCIINSVTKKGSYKRFIKKNKNIIEYDISFNEDYLKIKNENVSQKINYCDIKKYKERDFVLYLLTDNNIIPVSELELDSNLVEYIKYHIDNKKDDNITNNELKEYTTKKNKKRKGIEVVLILLFIFSCFTPWVALFGWAMLININNATGVDAFSYTYGAFLGIIIPLLSLILGIIYHGKGIKCVKNIVIGIIMSGFILLISSISLISDTFNFQKDYSEINVYKDIIGIELPKEAKYTSIKWDQSYLKNHISSTAKFKDKDESEIFYSNIKNSNNWIMMDNVSTILNNFIPDSMICYSKNKCYYSVYIDELGSYNTIPNETGDYHVKALMYDPDINTLKIEDFEYSYKK